MTEDKKIASIEYHLVRTNRRTLALTLDRHGELTAHAPLHMPLREVERFVMQKQDWILKQQQKAKELDNAWSRYGVWDGGLLPYLGGELKVARTAGNRAVAKDGTLYLPEKGDAVKQTLQWMHQQAEHILPEQVQYWSERMGVAPELLTFGHARQRWGSMASNGIMRLNIALLHCPPKYIDYVIVHELAHRVHPNHSPAFHAYVEQILPGAAALREQMKEWAPCLTWLRSDCGNKG